MKSSTVLGKLLLGILYMSTVVAILVAVWFVVSIKKETGPKVLLGGEEINVTIADTPMLREQGLSGHKSLGNNEGMLFVFQQPGPVGFWMKDMLFPIDIIWFNSNQEVVDVWENALPSSYPEIHSSQRDAKYVLEVPAGFYSLHYLKLGDKFDQTQ